MEIVDLMKKNTAYSVFNLAKLSGQTVGMVKGELRTAQYAGDVEVCSVANAKGKFYRLKRRRPI